jgi:hypothetical protein
MNVIRNACIEKDKINKKCGNRHQTLKKFLGIGCNRLLSAFHSGALMLAQQVIARLCVGCLSSTSASTTFKGSVAGDGFLA